MSKQEHSGTGHNINAKDVYFDSITKRESLLSEIINALGKKLFIQAHGGEGSLHPFKIENKIVHNTVKRYRPIIDECKIHFGGLAVIYNEIDSQGSNKKLIVLSNIKTQYIKVREEYISRFPDEDQMVIIRINSDNIIEEVEARLLKIVEQSSNIHATTEEILLSLQTVMVDAFINCKILEEPA